MKQFPAESRINSQGGFTLVETLIASSIFSVVMGVVMMGFMSFSRVHALATDYAMARLTLSDYLNMDLRRSSDFTPTLMLDVTRGGWKVDEWTLPCAIIAPNYISTAGVPTAPTRATMTSAEWEAAKDSAISRGKFPPPIWTVAYGTSQKLVTYEQFNNTIIRREGWGTVTRPTPTTVSWTWTSTIPEPVQVAKGIIQIKGVYKAKEDLTPGDLTELPPDDIVTRFKANYTIRYIPSNFSKSAPQFNTIITNDILLTSQYYGL